MGDIDVTEEMLGAGLALKRRLDAHVPGDPEAPTAAEKLRAIYRAMRALEPVEELRKAAGQDDDVLRINAEAVAKRQKDLERRNTCPHCHGTRVERVADPKGYLAEGDQVVHNMMLVIRPCPYCAGSDPSSSAPEA